MRTLKYGNGISKDLMQLHDLFLKYARCNGTTLTARECRAIALQLVYELAKTSAANSEGISKSIIPLPVNANSNIPHLVA